MCDVWRVVARWYRSNVRSVPHGYGRTCDCNSDCDKACVYVYVCVKVCVCVAVRSDQGWPGVGWKASEVKRSRGEEESVQQDEEMRR